MADKVRQAHDHSHKRWANGSTTSSNQYTLGYDVVAKRMAAL